jgi:hypothetical protein
MKLDKAANLAVILGIAVFLVVVGRNELTRHKPRVTSPDALTGKTISLPGVHFPQARNSFVLVLSTGCHFCQASLPFYRELASKSQGQLDMLAVFPQPQTEAQAFLQNASVTTTQVISASLDSVGVSATPTLLLVDGTGKVQAAWIGLLDEKRQQQAFSHVLLKSSSASNQSLLSVDGTVENR